MAKNIFAKDLLIDEHYSCNILISTSSKRVISKEINNDTAQINQEFLFETHPEEIPWKIEVLKKINYKNFFN